VDAFLREHGARDHPAMAVSLSGGVDSMVIAKLLTALSPTHGGFRVAACHIDYANRPESGAEAEFVLDWCVGPRAVASTPGAVHMIRAFASIRLGSSCVRVWEHGKAAQRSALSTGGLV
jgi:hypothetical protein